MASTHRHPLLFLLLLSLCFAGSNSNSTALSQCSTLLDFKHSFTNSSSKLDTWLPSTDCCSWDGITCDVFSGLVTGIDLSGCFMAGGIRTSLFNLTSLQTLNLAYNLFDRVPIPNGFELLPNLTSLNLSNAGFSGQIPIGIAKLRNLVSLDLSSFYFNVVPSSALVLKNPDFQTLIQNMSNLRELYLDSVRISSAHGYEWSAAVAKWTPKLTALSLVGCSITGPFHSSFAELHNLSVIQLDENELNCSIPDFFGNFSSLSVIGFGNCQIKGVFPEKVFLLKNLTVVDLAVNEDLSGSLPDFPDESKLERLILSNTNFSGPLPTSTGKLQYLTTVDLSICHFSGVIPSSISNLTQLIRLDLSYNRFSGAIPLVLPPRISELILTQNMFNGPIPSSVGKHQHLINLDLANNLLVGQIPSSLFTLPSLRTLQLYLNQLSGQLQDFSNGSLSQLVVIDLSNNLLQGEIPRSFFQLSRIVELNLASNNFTGSMELDQFSTFRNLSSLDLSFNNISIHEKDLHDAGSFPIVYTLMLASCNLTKIPSFLRYQNEMSSLDLSNNKIAGTVPNWIWSIGNISLSYLNLSYNLFTSLEVTPPNISMSSVSTVVVVDLNSNLLSGPLVLPPLYIITLDYSNNQFSSSIPSNINSYLAPAIFFSLADNNLIGEIPFSICNATNLRVINLSNNKLTGLIPPCLLEGTNMLGVLNLRGNQLHGTIPQNISQGCGLETLDLNGNHLEGRLPQSLVNCNFLEFLDLGNNHISDPFPFWLGKSHSLRVLILRSNELYGPVEPPQGIYTTDHFFSMLQIFDISSNYLNGSLPFGYYKFKSMMVNSVVNRTSLDFHYLQFDPSYYHNSVTIISKGLTMELIKTMTIFTSIDLSNNCFKGNIPEIIGEANSLNVLNISHNALTGGVPPSIGNLLQLESLDLSGNKLSGNIPQELSKLTFLEFLNLTNNNLPGEIPQGNQFSTFSNASFEGNEDLCGPPLTKQCKATPTKNGGKQLPLKSKYSPSTYVIGLALFIGIGFGMGIAIILVLQNVS